MNAATDFDLGPLTWVKGEIDLALQRAEEALAAYEAGADPTSLKHCRTHVHQVFGALSIVGLDGVAQVTESVESLLVALEDGSAEPGRAAMEALHQAFAALSRYLDDLMAGEPNQALRLLPVYQALAAARGIDQAHASDLFHPDLSLRPPRRRQAAAAPLPAERLQALLKSARMDFQKGLIRYLRDPENSEAAREAMRQALSAIESVQETQAARSFWWIALAFVEALADPALASQPSIRPFWSRIDAQIRRLLQGSNSVAERVMREALYVIAQAPAGLGTAIAEVQSTFGLSSLLPASPATAPAPPQETALRKLREAATGAEESWNKFCTGGHGSLAAFAGNAAACARLTEEIGQTDLKRLGQGLGAVASWLTEDAARFGDAVAMEVATAILLLQNAQENFHHLGTDFASQVDLMVARLYACIAGKPAANDEAIPFLDEMSRRAQERLLIGQVGREIQSNLGQIEQVLDGFFRDPAKRNELVNLETPIKQISGALAMLGHFGAVGSLKECGRRIEQFAQPDYQPADEDFEAVANQLSLLGFFVDALQNGETDFEAFVRRMKGAPPVDSEPATLAEQGEAGPSVESQLAQQARDIQTLAEALRAAPEDGALQNKLRDSLEAIRNDADLVANQALGNAAKAALDALQAGGTVDAAVEAALAGLQPRHAESAQPSAETLQLAESSHDEIDAELLAIFLEEANEVLATMGGELSRLKGDPRNNEALTTIRRGAHTLKGSGRMVGLTELGETAWELEQTLNFWLRQELAVTPELIGMIADGHALFTDWVKRLESGAVPRPETAGLVALAMRLRGAEPEFPAAATAAEQPSPVRSEDETPGPAVVAELLMASAASGEMPAEDLLDIELLEIDLPELGEPSPSVIEGLPPGTEDETAEPLLGTPEPRRTAEEAPSLELSEEPSAAGAEPFAQGAEADAGLEMAQAQPVADIGEIPPSTVPSPTLYDIFREEARGHLQTLVEHYGALEIDPEGPTAFEMTRAAHTLGGIAATVGLMPLHRLAIALEHALLRRDASAHPASIEGLETVRQAIITLEDMFEALAGQQEPEEQPQLIAALDEIFQVQPAAPSAPAEPAPAIAEEARAPVEEAAGAPSAAEPALPQLTDELDEQLLPIFLEEAGDQLRGLTGQLRDWRSDPGSDVPPHAIARLLHTFKGNARMAGAMNLGEATHQLETRVEDALRAGRATPAFIDDIEAGCDALAQAVEILRQGPTEPIPVAEFEPAGGAAPAAPPAVPVDVEHEAEAGGQRAMLRIRADLIDRLVNEAGELSIARTRIEGEMRSLKSSLLDLTENVIRLRRQLREIEIQAEGQIQARVAQSPAGEAEFDPLELDRFTRFQELTRFMAESVNDVATVQQNLLKNLDDANAAILAQARLNRGLQQELMGVRMLPFASQAERLYRIVRQTAKEVGKRATLDVVGGQVEIDRSVLDKMLAPIEHMLRNAVTHGIEDREGRLAAGKSEAGEITLALVQEGNEIILSLRDDGRGLDAGRIRERAKAMGLIAGDEPLDEAQLYDYIFQPGFSTATELTQVAGRGVGMDVVKTEVGALGGRIEILSELGRGTTFRLYLPLTLAVTQTLLLRVGSQRYAVPSAMIEQVLELKEKALAELREAGEAQWQGNHYPFHFLPQLLGDAEAVPEVHRQSWVLLLRSGSQRVAVLVDELQGNHEVVVKNIGAQLARVVGIAGATVLGDGEVVLILNPVALASRAPQAARPAGPGGAATALPAAAEVRPPTVMVVDDSLTVRKITGRLLAREGYQVVVAKDGVDALEQMLDLRPDVILSDIEMPRMDGFDLVRNIRGDARLRDIPVIMITSRTADKHRNYALEIGANHYLGKPYDEDELLRLVAGYVGTA